MKFLLTEEQRQLVDMATRLVGAPGAHEQLRAVVDGKSAWDEAQWRRLCEFGAAGLIVPEEYGGSGLTFVELALLSEVLGHAASATPLFGHALATLAILRGGSAEQRERLLPALASGERIGTVAISESGGRWTGDRWELADGTTLSGTKTNVPFGLAADLAVVGLAGGKLAVVELAAAGVTRRAMDGIDPTRPLAVIEFAGAPAERLHGAGAADALRDAALALLAADGFGGARRCLEMATDYAQTREAFGAKIAQFQAVKHQLANIALEVEPCRGLYWIAAYRSATGGDDTAQVAALAKAHICDVFARVSRHNIELHGGIGFTWEYDAQIWLKRAMWNYAWGGGSDLHFGRAADLAGW